MNVWFSIDFLWKIDASAPIFLWNNDPGPLSFHSVDSDTSKQQNGSCI